MNTKLPASLVDYPSPVLINRQNLAKVKTAVKEALKQLSAEELRTGYEYFSDSDWLEACEQVYQEKFIASGMLKE